MSLLKLELFINNLFDRQAITYRYAECASFKSDTGAPLCGQQSYAGVTTPRTVGLQFGQKF